MTQFPYKTCRTNVYFTLSWYFWKHSPILQSGTEHTEHPKEVSTHLPVLALHPLWMHATHPLLHPSNFTGEWPAFKLWVTAQVHTPWCHTIGTLFPSTVAITKWMHTLHFECLQGPVPVVSGKGPLQGPPHWSTDTTVVTIINAMMAIHLIITYHIKLLHD